MPHQCVRCNTFYNDGSKNIIEGCSCGGKLFYYIRKEKLEQLRNNLESLPQLSPLQQKEIERDVRTIVGNIEEEKPVVLDVENIKIVGPGKYELDLVQLFKGEPLVFKIEEGKYFIDIAETFRRLDKKRKQIERTIERFK
ncbi:hypothetical protein HY483_04450 [Candidatus Woesearchaeota archaeon]|nr:hypothetical protein [Candidatus Woesearchaeota archaeon]